MRHLTLFLCFGLFSWQQMPTSPWIDQVRARLSEKNYRDAAELLQKELAREGSNYEFLNLLAATLERAGDIAGATDYYVKALELRATSTTVRLNLALNYVRRAQFNLASTEFTRLLKEDSLQSTQEPIYQQGPDDEIAARFVSNVPARENDWYELGMLFLRHGRLQGAQAVFQEATRRFSNSAKLEYGLGWARQEGGRFQAAREAFMRALQLQPSFPDAALRLAYAYYIQGEYPIAVQVYEGLLRSSPKIYEAHYFLAQALTRLNPPAFVRAIDHLRQAVEINPRSFDSHAELGRVYLATEKLPEARRELELAIALNPDNDRAHYHLAHVFTRLGQSSIAQRELQAFEELKRKNRDRAREIMLADLVWPAEATPARVIDRVRGFIDMYKATLLAGDYLRIWQWLTPDSRELYENDPERFVKIARQVFGRSEMQEQIRQCRLRGGKLMANRVLCEFEADSAPKLPPLVLVQEGHDWRIDYAFDWTTAGLGYLGSR